MDWRPGPHLVMVSLPYFAVFCRILPYFAAPRVVAPAPHLSQQQVPGWTPAALHGHNKLWSSPRAHTQTLSLFLPLSLYLSPSSPSSLSVFLFLVPLTHSLRLSPSPPLSPRRGQPILAVEPFLKGKYVKHSNNYGFVSEEDRCAQCLAKGSHAGVMVPNPQRCGPGSPIAFVRRLWKPVFMAPMSRLPTSRDFWSHPQPSGWTTNPPIHVWRSPSSTSTQPAYSLSLYGTHPLIPVWPTSFCGKGNRRTHGGSNVRIGRRVVQ